MTDFQRGNGTSLSFEVFPANTQVGTKKLIQTLNELQDLQPNFISVTCSNNKANIEETTVKIADYVTNSLRIPTIAHLPAAYLSKQQVSTILGQLEKLGIRHVLALRGDIVEGIPPKRDFSYASDLVTFIQEQAPYFDISGACYPEIHPDSDNRISDIKHLRKKVEAGCSQLITQLFFDNEQFYQFKEGCSLAGIDAPILAGIMPIVNRKQALRLIKVSSSQLPKKFLAILEKYEHNPVALRDAGLAYAIDQIVDLVTQGVDGIHLYTMNQSDTARQIHQATKSLFQTTELLGV